MNRCKTCKWWKWTVETPRPIPGSPEYPPQIQFKCTSNHVAGDDSQGMVDGEQDGGYGGGVWTGPDFGCIHHEETQEQLTQDHPGYADQLIKRELGPGALRPAMNFESVSEQIKRGVIPRRPNGSICEA